MLSNITELDWKWGSGRGSSVHLLTFGHTISKSHCSPMWGKLDGSGRYSRKSFINNLTSAVCFWSRISMNFGFDWYWQFLPFLVLCLSACKWNTLVTSTTDSHGIITNHVYVSCSDPMFHDPHVASIRYELATNFASQKYHRRRRAWVQRSRKPSDADCEFVWVRSVQQSDVAISRSKHGTNTILKWHGICGTSRGTMAIAL